MNANFNILTGIAVMTLLLSGCNTYDDSHAEQKSETKSVKHEMAAGEMKKEKTLNKTDSIVKVTKDTLLKDELNQLVSLQATVTYLDFEGGFYGLVTKSGEKLLPMNMSSDFRQHGAIVKVKGQKQKDILTTQQWGTPFKVTEIKLIKAGSKTNPADM